MRCETPSVKKPEEGAWATMVRVTRSKQQSW